MPSAAKASSSSQEISPLDSVRAALNAMEDFAPKHDETKMTALKEQAEMLRKPKRENAFAQKNEKRKRARILAKGSGWEKNDILECFRLKHEQELKRQRMKQEREEKRPKTEMVTLASEIAKTPTEVEEPVS